MWTHPARAYLAHRSLGLNGLFCGHIEFKGESSSDTQQDNSTTTTDQRVGADNGAVVIQDNGQQNISFSPEVAALAKGVVNSIVDFSNGVVETAGKVVTNSLAAQERATNAVLDFGKTALASAPSTTPSTAASILTNQVATNLRLPLIIGGVIVLYLIIKKGKL